MKSRSYWVGALVALMMVVSPVMAADGYLDGEGPAPEATFSVDDKNIGGTRPDMETYGTTGFVQQALSIGAFTPLSDGEWGSSGTHYYRTGGSNSGICADVTLPTGAVLWGLTYYLRDNSATANMQITLWRHDFDPGTTDTLFDLSTDFAGTPDWVMLYESLTAGDHTVDNDRAGYRLCMFQWSETGSLLGTRGTTFWYKLQVSPAPMTATFNDVGTLHPFFRFVEALVSSGITAGCGGGNYCPDNPITRGEMAVFLSGALGLNYPD